MSLPGVAPDDAMNLCLTAPFLYCFEGRRQAQVIATPCTQGERENMDGYCKYLTAHDFLVNVNQIAT
jgi:hypothetical protein